MIRMQVVLFALCSMPFAAQAAILTGQYASSTYPDPPGPTSVSWELSNADRSQSVVASVDGLTPMIGHQYFFFITEQTAPSFGVDWAAWEAAVVNPAFTRSFLSFGGLTREGPILRTFTFEQGFDLYSFSIVVNDYENSPAQDPSVIASATDISFEVPEPTGALLLFVGFWLAYFVRLPHQPVCAV